jgi:hypothetical protein
MKNVAVLTVVMLAAMVGQIMLGLPAAQLAMLG